MHNVTGRRRRIGYNGDTRVPYARAGWEDARNGRPWDYALVDNAKSPACGVAYETARFRVIALITEGNKVPAWNAVTVPPRIHAAITQANAINKEARNNGVQYW
jgi:hypothetical protein